MVAAPVAVALIWLVASPLLDINLAAKVGADNRTVSLVSIVATALLAGLAGTAVVVALDAANSQPRLAWLLSSSTVLVLSLFGPLLATTWSAGIVLALMHLITGAILIPGLLPSARTTADSH